MKRKIALVILLGAFSNTYAADYSNIFDETLSEGRGNMPAPINAHTKQGIKAMQDKTKSDGEITIRLTRIIRFKSQPRCGRITMAFYQESTNTVFNGVGVDMNICVDGQPPLRECRDKPLVLVNSMAACKDGSTPIDTPEIAKAIADSVAKGELTPEQVKLKLEEAEVKRAK